MSLTHSSRAMIFVFLGGCPAFVAVIALLPAAGFSTRFSVTVVGAILLLWGLSAVALRRHVTRPHRVLDSVLESLREDDYTIRGRVPAGAGPASTAVAKVNELADRFREQRLQRMDAEALLSRVLEQIEVALFVFDDHARLGLLNASATQLLNLPAERAVGQTAEGLGLQLALEGASPRTIDLPMHDGGPWELRRAPYRRQGRPHTLVVLADVGQALRAEEQAAFQRLVRVLGHEINNSLAPIQSLAQGLQSTVEQQEADWQEDVATGLQIIGRRASSLGRFLRSYTQLARLPTPQPRPSSVEELVARVVGLEADPRLTIDDCAPVDAQMDPDQLEQVLINLVRNALEALPPGEGSVRISWSAGPRAAELRVTDDGPGIADATNLFVPFFTTKAEGAGIGLVLSRRIVESHGGRLTLSTPVDGVGCVAAIRLPLPTSSDPT